MDVEIENHYIPSYAGLTLESLYKELRIRSKIASQNTRSKFLYARKIQTIYRGWRVREMMKTWHRSATIIQKTWRGLAGRKRYFQILECTVQREIEEYHNRSARKIQSLWRGYYSRQHIHDHYKMKTEQVLAAKRLIKCVAHKLHHLLRTHQIPGIYSIRNSYCLSKIEELLASLKFKEYNTTVRMVRDEIRKKTGEAISNSYLNKELAQIPYGAECGKLWRSPDADVKMLEMLDTYWKIQEGGAKHKKLRRFKKIPDTSSTVRVAFMETMKRWGLEDEDNCAQNLFHNPNKIDSFISDMKLICKKFEASH